MNCKFRFEQVEMGGQGDEWITVEPSACKNNNGRTGGLGTKREAGCAVVACA